MDRYVSDKVAMFGGFLAGSVLPENSGFVHALTEKRARLVPQDYPKPDVDPVVQL